MSLNSISGLGCFSISGMMDPEYQRIIRELQALGITPTGDKSADKAKLQRVQSAKNSENAQPETNVQANKTFGETIEEISGINMNDKVNAAAMTGATQIAELNKLRFLGGI